MVFADHAQDVATIQWGLLGGAGFALWTLGLMYVRSQFDRMRDDSAKNVASVKIEVEEFRKQDEERHKDANEKIDALFDLHRRIEDVMRGELRTLERNLADVRERVVIIESKCYMMHPSNRPPGGGDND